ncbi:MAG: Amuc_1102 family pilus-like protein [Chthoniobacteraceae bacterium]
MKKFLLSACALTVTAIAASAQTPVGPGSVKLGKVQPEVVKTPEYNITGGPQKRSKIGQWLEVEVEFETKPEDIDELTFKYTILMEKKLLDGEVTHIAIPKGRDHYSVIYVSPRAIEKLTGGKPLTGGSIENVWVEVSKQGQILDKASFRPGVPPNLPHLAGLVLNKDETPFAPLFYDRYEAIKKTR